MTAMYIKHKIGTTKPASMLPVRSATALNNIGTKAPPIMAVTINPDNSFDR